MRRVLSVLVILFLGIAAGIAWATDPPLENWPVPKSAAFNKTAFADIAPGPVVFVGVDPCRVIDTRGNGFSGEWGPPSMPGGGTQRNFTIAGQCGIPVGVTAVSFNFTVWAPVTRGDIRVFPTGGGTPTVSTLNWEANILAQANAAVAPLGGGKITVQVDGSGTINLIVDVNGYYIGGGNPLNSNERLWISGSGFNLAMVKGTNSASGGYGGLFEALGGGSSIGVIGRESGGSADSIGVQGQSLSGSASAIGVSGIATAGIGVQGTSTSNYGVNGTSGSSYGVYGTSTSAIGVYGYSATGADGVFGKSGDSNAAGVHGQLTASIGGSPAVWGEHQATGSAGIGVKGTHAGAGYGVEGVAYSATGTNAKGVYGIVYSTADGTMGVEGYATASSGKSYGVYGVSNSSALGAAGVKGVDYSGDANGYTGPAGIIGSSVSSYGILATSQFIGAKGIFVNSSGTMLSQGYLGFDAVNGVWATGNVGATGAKTFVEPHPSDPSLVIRYAALEGPEVGTYFRGSGQTVGGIARIPVPESFRTVTEEEGLTVQVTPVGGLTQMAVSQYDLNEIVVESARDTKFFIHVNGVRRGYRDWEPVAKGTEYAPESPAQKMPVVFSSEIKKRLVANGTYYEDGTVNLHTAERLGWVQKWREAEDHQKQKVSRTAQDPAPQQ